MMAFSVTSVVKSFLGRRDSPQSSQRPQSKAILAAPEAWLIALLLLLAMLTYVNTLQNGFVYDDNNEVLTNPYIRSFSHVGDIFSTRILAHLGARGATNYYRPISILGFLICYKLFGLLPYGFHLANVLLNALIVCVLFGLTKRLFQDQWLAFTAAAIFALHPIHTESVAWVSGVTDLDLALFYLATFWFFLASARPQRGAAAKIAGASGAGPWPNAVRPYVQSARSEWMQLGMVGSFILALLSKEQAVTLPLIAMIFEHFYRGDRASTTWRQKVSRYSSLWLLVVVYVLFRIRFFGAFAPVQLTRNVSWYQAILSAFPLAGLYVWKMIWPVHLIAYYPFHKSFTLLDPRVWAGVAALGLCAVAFTALWKRHHLASFGFIWFFINIAPVLNSRWLGPNVFTERYLYLPSVGLCWVAAWGILEIWDGSTARPRAWGGAFGVLLGVLAILAFTRIVSRNGDWRDDETYYRVTLAAVPEAASLRLNLGAVYWNGMQPAAAEREWKKALEASPDSPQLLNNLGLVYTGRKENDEAIEYFQRSMRLRPNYTDAHLNLGRVYEAIGKTSEAELQLRAAVALAPLSVATRNELGNFYFTAGRLPEAKAQFQASAASIPNLGAYDPLGDIARREGRHEAAEQAYRQAIGLDEFDSHARFGLAAVLEAQGRAAEAVEQYRAGLSVDPRNPEAQAALQRLTANSPHGKTPNP
ncbi:MAG: tetratricopeptide repeat protein [Terriglobia bacterium]|jgi:Tfp pilus assembly protein PilF